MTSAKIQKSLTVFLLFSSSCSFAYQLPQAEGLIGICNSYANKASDDFIRDNNVEFKGLDSRESNEFKLMTFYSSVSATCNVAHTMAMHGTPTPQAIPMAAGSLKSSILSITKNMTSEDADRLLYPAAIYGYSL